MAVRQEHTNVRIISEEITAPIGHPKKTKIWIPGDPHAAMEKSDGNKNIHNLLQLIRIFWLEGPIDKITNRSDHLQGTELSCRKKDELRTSYKLDR